MIDRMKWWAVRKTCEKGVVFVKMTHAQMIYCYHYGDVYSYHVVRPEHKAFPKAYRKYNERRNMDYIEAAHKAECERLKELNAPQIIQDNADTVGFFGPDYSLFLDNEIRRSRHPKNAKRLADDARTKMLTWMIGEDASIDDLALANMIIK